MNRLLLVLAALAVVAAGAAPSGTFAPAWAPEYDSVAVGAYRFSAASGAPELPDGLSARSEYHVVHLRGPVYDWMLAELAAGGVEVIQYVPFNAYVCRMADGLAESVRALGFVDWVGQYEPAYKLSPLFSQSGIQNPQSGIPVLIVLFYREDMAAALERVEALGASVLEASESDAFKVIRAEVESGRVADIARVAAVAWVEPAPDPVHCNEQAQWVTQTWRPGIRRLWLKGVDGKTQVVNTADTGILMGSTTHDMARDPAVSVTTWGDFPTHRKVIGYRTWSGSSAAFGDNTAGSWHGTHTFGTICGNDGYVSGTSGTDGMAANARMYFMDIGTSSGSLSVPSDLTNLYTLPFNGNAAGAARVSSHSWGSTIGAGTYTAYCQQTDQFMWNHKDFLIVYAAGNDGPGATTVIPPGTSKDILTGGAVANGTSATLMADFSGRGPCNDTRYKPTVTAPGQTMLSSVGPSATSYGYMQGTSMATPCIAGNAALVRDYFAKGFYPTGESVPGNRRSYISAALVKACIVNSAAPDISGSTIPDNNTGWGRVNADYCVFFKDDVRKLWVEDDTTGLSTGQYDEFTVTVNNQSEPLKVTLVWTDYPANSGANPAIVNNLDLQVTGPNAAQYRGNQYTGGQSTPNPTAWDNRNVEECVRRNAPELGDWTIRVNATNVPQGTRQPYALVVSGGLGTAGTPVLALGGSRLEDPAGNNNGRFDPGETVHLTDTLRNLSGAAANGVTGKLRLAGASPYITLLDTVAAFGDIPVGGSAHNGASRFRMSASSGTPPGTVVEFVLALSGSGFVQNIPFELAVGSSGFQVIWGPKALPSFPSTGFPYGLAYNPVNERLYVMNAYSRRIYIYSSDTTLTYYGYISAPDTLGTDIKYCAYDSSFWVAANFNSGGKKVSKMTPEGTVFFQFNNLATDYPVGLAWHEDERQLYLSDRRTALNTFPQYVYVADTIGTQVRRMDVPMRANYGARCLAIEPQGPNNGTLLMVYTAFNSGGTAIDSCGVYEFNRSNLALVQRVLLPGWNCRGIEYDPRDGNYWVTIPQSPDRSIAKIGGFYGPPTGAAEPGRPGAVKLRLDPVQPNPARDRVLVRYQLPVKTRARLSVCDLAGRVRAVLCDGYEEQGTGTFAWDSRQLASGVYFLRLEANGERRVSRFVLSR